MPQRPPAHNSRRCGGQALSTRRSARDVAVTPGTGDFARATCTGPAACTVFIHCQSCGHRVIVHRVTGACNQRSGFGSVDVPPFTGGTTRPRHASRAARPRRVSPRGLRTRTNGSSAWVGMGARQFRPGISGCTLSHHGRGTVFRTDEALRPGGLPESMGSRITSHRASSPPPPRGSLSRAERSPHRHE